MKLLNNKKILLKSTIFSFVAMSPLLAFAQQANNLNTMLIRILQIIQFYVIPLIIAVALLLFLWGILKYVISKDDASRKESIAVITNGIIVLFVMVSVWGLVWLVSTIFNVNIYNNPQLQNKPIDTDRLIIR